MCEAFVCVLYSGEKRNRLGSLADLDMPVAAGFGRAVVTCNDHVRLSEEYHEKNRRRGLADLNCMTVRHAEELIRRVTKRRPSANAARWRIEIDTAFWSAVWERQAPRKWVCVEAGPGFA